MSVSPRCFDVVADADGSQQPVRAAHVSRARKPRT
jgi:hypothetical protein